MAESGKQVNEILDELCYTAGNKEKITVGEIAESLGHRGFGPFLSVPALIEITPIGGIPGVPSVLALIIALFAVQIVFRRKYMWLPDFIERRSVSEDRIESATRRLRPLADWLDRWFHERLPRFADSGSSKVAAAIVILLCLTVPPMELLPFASTIPMGTIALIGLALTVRDGALMLAAYVLAAVGLGVVAVSGLGG